MTSPPSSLTLRNLVLFWGGVFALFIGFVWLFSDILLPFVLGAAVAYLLDPIVEKLSQHKVPRWLSAASILLVFFTFITGILALIIPFAYREMAQLAEAVPGYIDKFWVMVEPYRGWLEQYIEQGDFESLRQTLQNNIGRALKVSTGVLGGLASGGQALVGLLSVMVLTPIVAFFMMYEWPRMTGWIDSLLPRASYNTIRDLLSQVNGKVSGFVRGQISVAFVLGLLYAVALTVAGLNFGFLIGLMAGILSIIPLVGSTVGLITSVIVAWLQSGELAYVGLIAVIFFVGQFAEGNILTPKLLGDTVGLHPLWILFALLAGGSLFGIVGMLLSVPVAASAGVLISYALSRYKESVYYNQDETTDTGGTETEKA